MNKLIALLTSLLLFSSSQVTFAGSNTQSQKIELSSPSMTMPKLAALTSSAFTENSSAVKDLEYEIKQRKEERATIKDEDELLAIDAEIEVLTSELRSLAHFDPNYIRFSDESDSSSVGAIYFKNFVNQASNYETFEYVFNLEAETYKQAIETANYEDLCSSIENLNNLMVSNIIYVDRFNKSTTRHPDIHQDYQALLKLIIQEKERYKTACHYK